MSKVLSIDLKNKSSAMPSSSLGVPKIDFSTIIPVKNDLSLVVEFVRKEKLSFLRIFKCYLKLRLKV